MEVQTKAPANMFRVLKERIALPGKVDLIAAVFGVTVTVVSLRGSRGRVVSPYDRTQTRILMIKTSLSPVRVPQW